MKIACNTKHWSAVVYIVRKTQNLNMHAVLSKTTKSLLNFHDIYEGKKILLLTILNRQISTSQVHTICEFYKC